MDEYVCRRCSKITLAKREPCSDCFAYEIRSSDGYKCPCKNSKQQYYIICNKCLHLSTCPMELQYADSYKLKRPRTDDVPDMSYKKIRSGYL